MNEQKLKTGTTTIGIVCSDGIILAADKRMTAGNFIADRETEKVVPIVDDIAVTTAGTVSEIQRLVKLLRAELKLLEVRTTRKVTVKEAANLLTTMNYYGIRQMGEWALAAFLVAGKDINGFSLFDVSPDGVIKKHDKYTADGSGMVFALPIIESKWKKGINIQEGIKLAVEAINAAQLRDNASGSGFDVWTITQDGLKKVLTKDLTMKAEV
ncbi:TPA: proteasome subunit beta [Candidatus Woesearchaeota archaeon]|nr:proteasome subunit beta [Candidatus Woesearchaeota archaeon]HIH39528.1 proteasome subunit beta [Candidatus Woesearchaeota archaeon]